MGLRLLRVHERAQGRGGVMYECALCGAYIKEYDMLHTRLENGGYQGYIKLCDACVDCIQKDCWMLAVDNGHGHKGAFIPWVLAGGVRDEH